ncbi:MAG TPA: glycosyltransferase family 4 protein, partial [Bacteroidales bacterium]
LVPITKVDGEKLQNMGNIKPVLVTPASFDPQKILYEPDSVRYPSVFFIGALDWTPNQEGLFWFVDKVWPLVKKQRNDIEFTVAGRNAPSWLIRKLKKRKINFMGEVEDSQKFMNTFAVMIVPLFAGSGMRVKIAEGMLLGKAIVTTTLGTEGIETTHEENIMIADSIWDFSESVLQLISKRDFYDSISKKARLFALNYNQNSMNIEELLNFYNSSKI